MAGMNELVLTQDLSSGRVHKRYRMPGGQLATYEGCNLDDAGDYSIVTIAGEGISPVSGEARLPWYRCRNCFPQGDDDASTWPESVP